MVPMSDGQHIKFENNLMDTIKATLQVSKFVLISRITFVVIQFLSYVFI